MGWIGVDLDGTLAVYKSKQGIKTIGEPVPEMLERVKTWIAEGKDVRIVTARVSGLFAHQASAFPYTDEGKAAYKEAADQYAMILDWCKRFIGRALYVTAVKDFEMEELWDDRAVSVEKNTGRVTTSHIFSEPK